MNWLLWLVVANAAIFALEWVYRTAWFTGFWSHLYLLIIPILIGQLGLFYGFRLAPSLFLAGAVFTLMNIVLRIGNSLILGEKVGPWQLLALFLMVAGIIILKLK